MHSGHPTPVMNASNASLHHHQTVKLGDHSSRELVLVLHQAVRSKAAKHDKLCGMCKTLAHSVTVSVMH